MEKFTSILEKILVPVAEKVSSNRYLKSLSGGFASTLPILILGAIATLLASLNFEFYQNLITSVGLKQVLSFIPRVTTDMLALYVVFLIGSSLTDNLGFKNESILGGVLSLFTFLLMIPLGVSGVSAGGETVVIGNALSTRFLGAPGIFTAIIIGMVVPTIFAFVLRKGWTIKMPAGVPPQISTSFAALIPVFIIGFVFALLRYVLVITDSGDLNSLIYTTIQTPLMGLGASPFTFMAFIFLVSLFWFFGLHGGLIVLPFLFALYIPLGLENLAAVEAGIELPHLIVASNWQVYASLGGGGGTLGLVFYMAFVAKSKRYKTLGKLALPASLVGINEPIIFGSPIVLNPYVLLPFILTPLTTFVIAYVLTVIGVVPPLNGVSIPLGTPVVFAGFLAGGWRVAILQIVLIGVQFVIYFPFIRLLDKKAVIEEMN